MAFASSSLPCQPRSSCFAVALCRKCTTHTQAFFPTSRRTSPTAIRMNVVDDDGDKSASIGSAPRLESDMPLLIRAAFGQPVERTPVWLLRQAGRYMESFRAYSDKLPFRTRSEDASIVRTLSLQPWHTFGTDAVILFSDILTPLPALGIDFDVIPGKGPVLPNPVRSVSRAQQIWDHVESFNPSSSLPFVSEALKTLRADVAGTDSALLGFVGAPFTLAAYAIEGGSSKHIAHTKRLMLGPVGEESGALRVLLDAITQMVIKYAIYQLDSGAHAVQLFESWAHHLSPSQFELSALPWVRLAAEGIKKERPNAPLFFFVNGAGGKLEMMKNELANCVNVFALDSSVDMADARRRLGNEVCIQGNVDPAVLLAGSENTIRSAVQSCLLGARPGPHILNLGHGVVKETPEKAVRVFCEAAKFFTKDELNISTNPEKLSLSWPSKSDAPNHERKIYHV